MNSKEPNQHEALCPNCGAEAQWWYVNSNKSRVQVTCPDCGSYEMDREEFDQQAIDSAEIKGPDRE
jgi:predicted RNA-binding Zn-ribbon protein involved in translation (DUF1610 family)